MLQELSILQDVGDTTGECRAHGNLGAVHMSLGNNTLALRCFQEQLERARDLKDELGEAQAYGNMGITRMNLSHFEEAIQNFEAQLKALENSPKAGMKEKARVFGNLGDCFDALGNLGSSVKYHEQFLSLSLKSSSLRDQDKAYRGLGLTNKNMGNLQEALVRIQWLTCNVLISCHFLSLSCSLLLLIATRYCNKYFLLLSPPGGNISYTNPVSGLFREKIGHQPRSQRRRLHGRGLRGAGRDPQTAGEL